jgi:hypothetical protein
MVYEGSNFNQLLFDATISLLAHFISVQQRKTELGLAWKRVVEITPGNNGFVVANAVFCEYLEAKRSDEDSKEKKKGGVYDHHNSAECRKSSGYEAPNFVKF